nr:glycosyltransferase [Lachnospiraceae bacterium]
MNRISVIVPAYNIENYISKCLDSILAQTYRDLEIITVDDGSSDRTGQILDEYAKKDDRIKVIHQKNKGLSGARNSALKVATGDYIGYVDGDDHIEPGMYETMLNACLQYDAQIAVTAYREVDETGSPVSDREFSGRIIPLSKTEALDVYISDNREYSIKNCVWSKLFKKEIVKDLIFPEGHNSEDILYTTRALCSSTTCVFTDIPLYDYLSDRPESIMNVKVSKRRLEDEIPFLREQLSCYKENVSDELYEKAVYSYARRLLFYYYDLKDRGMGRDANRIASIINEDRDLINRVYEKEFVSPGDRKRMELFFKSPILYRMTEKIYADMIVPLRQVPKGANRYITIIGNISFYLGVLFEIIIMFIAKSDYTNPIEGLMFRIPFVLFCIKVLCSRYSLKDILLMIILG